MAEKPTLYFTTGLPRSGSTALLSLLAQNPRIFAAPVSGMRGIFSGVYSNWDKNHFLQELPNPDAKRRVLRAILESYHETNRPLILDKDRLWSKHIALVEHLLERPIQMIVPVRPIPDILASFETLRERNPIEHTNADEALGPASTVLTRAAHFASEKGPLGMSYNALKDAVIAGYRDRMLFVDYDKLMREPEFQLERIYDFLGEPHFKHDLENVEQVVESDPRPHKLPKLHDVRPRFEKTSRPAREVLGAEVFARYDKPVPWREWI